MAINQSNGPLKFSKRTIAILPLTNPNSRYVKRDTVTPHLCVRITQTAKTFFWEKTIRRQQKRVTIGRFPEINIEQARKQAESIAADYVQGIDVAAEQQAARNELTVEELWQDFKANRKRKIPGKESEALNYQWQRHFDEWGDKHLSEISYAKARRLILNIRKTAPFYANRVQRHGQAMFNHAIKELRWKGDNPFSFALVSEKGRARKVRLQPNDMKVFMAGLEACSESMRVLFLSSLYTGRRMGECQAMRWVDLDLESGVWVLPETKSGESQQAIVPKALIDILVKRQRNAKGSWVFPGPSKSGHVEEIKKAWNQVREASGIHHLQARDLRRTLASWAQDVSMPIAAVQAQLGHADIHTTAKYYTSIDQTVQRAALDMTVDSMLKAGSDESG